MPRSTTNVPTAAEIRRRFIDFFKVKGGGAEADPARRGHAWVASSPVVPLDDPTLLFINAGMNQFKPIFLGQAEPGSEFSRLRRAVNSQKCIRAGGKHNDLEDVGKDTYHHTFFEMLGNWSFGDYFKPEAIAWAFELLTTDIAQGGLGIDPSRLYATYFGGDAERGLEPDEEARELWERHLPPERVLPFGMKDNFWEMGETGPCGPCSEIHYDRVGGRDASALVNQDDPDVIELWNLVFIQFDRRSETDLRPLPAKHVDTGMGLERLAGVLQGVRSNYDTDLFTPLFEAIRRETSPPREYLGYTGEHDPDRIDMAYRVVADHVRALAFAIADGATPSNEGRGYVLRRILRRGVRFGRQMIGGETGFMSRLVPDVVAMMGEAYPELVEHEPRIREVILDEEESFGRTLDKGIGLFEEVVERSGSRISGEDAFQLYDTYGFPLDLTQLMAEERGLAVDAEGFERCMAEQRARSRAATKTGEGGHGLALDAETIERVRRILPTPTDDSTKHERTLLSSRLSAIYNGADFDDFITASGRNRRAVGVLVERTCFYAESGGQVGDAGRIYVTDESTQGLGDDHEGGEFHVTDTRAYGGYVLHIGHMVRGELRVGDFVELHVDRNRRTATAGNHTATHLLNLALRHEIGRDADQRGSLVAPDHLRFDVSAKPISDEAVGRVEARVRQWIGEDRRVFAGVVPLAEAQEIKGLRAIFGEKYPPQVRVVSIGVPVEDLLAQPDKPEWLSYSVELCGGTHVESTSRIEDFAIVMETGIAKGIRRIEGLTGVPARAAIEAGESFARRIEEASRLEGEELAAELGELNSEIDALTMPVARKADLRVRLAELFDRVKAAQKQAGREAARKAVDAAKRIADDAAAAGERFLVAELPVGDDRKALQQAVKVMTDANPGTATMVLSADEGSGKVAIVASVPDDLVQAGLKAGDWVRAAAEACGGKGGGKPNQAQGGGTEPARIGSAIEAARDHARRALG